MNCISLAHTLHDALQDRQTDQISVALAGMQAIDVAETLMELDLVDALQILMVLPLERCAGVFGRLSGEWQIGLVARLPRNVLINLVVAMAADERADLFNRFDIQQREALLPALAQLERDDIRKLCSYAEGSAGALMTSEYSTLEASATAATAIACLRREAAGTETLYQTYVLDQQRTLLGTLSLRELILAPPETPVTELMVRPVISVGVTDSRESVAKAISRYDLLAVPVLDENRRLVGIVTCDDAMDVMVEEATEDFHKGAMVSVPLGNLKTASVGLLYRKRVFWLVLLVFGNLFSGAGIAAFEDIIASHIALVFFLPLLVDSGGNAGSQSATLMVRALATGDVMLRDWLRLLGRECFVALGLGLTMAAAVASLGAVRGGADIALIVASSMLIIVLVGSLIGMSLPFLLSRLRMDPATASGPLITTVADALGVLVYFGIASQVLEL